MSHNYYDMHGPLIFRERELNPPAATLAIHGMSHLDRPSYRPKEQKRRAEVFPSLPIPSSLRVTTTKKLGRLSRN
jgi:hypothetical protein